MKYRELGDTGIQIPLIGLGTMTWGQQNSFDEAFQQMDYAMDKGVNFLMQVKCTQCRQEQ